MSNYKALYLKAMILLDDISNYHEELGRDEEWSKKLRHFKNCFVSLDILRDSLKSFNILLIENATLIVHRDKLRKELEFINHLRNKIGGHLDDKVLEKAVQWHPFIFSEKIQDNKEAQIFFMYTSLIESSINSFIDVSGVQKKFGTEIDLIYPPYQKTFFNYIGELNISSIEFLAKLLIVLKSKIDFWHDDDMVLMAMKAGETDFNLKN
jgi:hypothetical protein